MHVHPHHWLNANHLQTSTWDPDINQVWKPPRAQYNSYFFCLISSHIRALWRPEKKSNLQRSRLNTTLLVYYIFFYNFFIDMVLKGGRVKASNLNLKHACFSMYKCTLYVTHTADLQQTTLRPPPETPDINQVRKPPQAQYDSHIPSLSLFLSL